MMLKFHWKFEPWVWDLLKKKEWCLFFAFQGNVLLRLSVQKRRPFTRENNCSRSVYSRFRNFAPHNQLTTSAICTVPYSTFVVIWLGSPDLRFASCTRRAFVFAIASRPTLGPTASYSMGKQSSFAGIKSPQSKSCSLFLIVPCHYV
jgi:hypothetical protein